MSLSAVHSDCGCNGLQSQVSDGDGKKTFTTGYFQGAPARPNVMVKGFAATPMVEMNLREIPKSDRAPSTGLSDVADTKICLKHAPTGKGVTMYDRDADEEEKAKTHLFRAAGRARSNIDVTDTKSRLAVDATEGAEYEKFKALELRDVADANMTKAPLAHAKGLSDLGDTKICLKYAPKGKGVTMHDRDADVEEKAKTHLFRAAGRVQSDIDVTDTKFGHAVDATKGTGCEKFKALALRDVPDANMDKAPLAHAKRAMVQLSHAGTDKNAAATVALNGVLAKPPPAKSILGKEFFKTRRSGLLSALHIEDPAMYLHRLYAAGALVEEIGGKRVVDDSSIVLVGDVVPPPEDAVPLPNLQ